MNSRSKKLLLDSQNQYKLHNWQSFISSDCPVWMNISLFLLGPIYFKSYNQRRVESDSNFDIP